MEPKVIFEDENMLVIDKPAGVTVNRAETTRGEETVQDWFEQKYGIRNTKYEVDGESDFVKRGGIVHRLDKETSGILLIAKTPESFINLQAQFNERTVKKKYTALVHGEVKPEEGEINVPVGRLPWNRMRFGVLAGGRESSTKYKVVSHFIFHNSYFSLLTLTPLTGRTHQIRVHLKYLGFPIVSDELYVGRKQAREDRRWCPRLFLHASQISFRHPKTGEEMTFEAELPEELQDMISKFEARNLKS